MNQLYVALRKEGLSPRACYGLMRLHERIVDARPLPDAVRKRLQEIGILGLDGLTLRVDEDFINGDAFSWLLVGMAYQGDLRVSLSDKGKLQFQNTEKGNRKAIRLIRNAATRGESV
jgi:hypothetical protein